MPRTQAHSISQIIALSTFAAALAGGLATETPAADPPIGLTLEIHARQIAPGEPVRIVVRSETPLTELTGRFYDDDVSFFPFSSTPNSLLWIGWGLVPLDAAPGMTTAEVHGVSRDGLPALGTHAVTIEHKPFPEEHLDVAPRYVEPPPEVLEQLAGERVKLDAIYKSRRDLAHSRSAFKRPVSGAPTSVFGTRRIYNGEPRSPHPGLDLRASTGTEIQASGPGRVVLAQELYYSGNTVIIDHGGGLFTLYAHLSRLNVVEGRDVAVGQVLGLSGATGRVTGPHLHWGAKIGARPFDPMALLDPRLW